MSEPATHSPDDSRIAVPFLVFSALLLALLIPDVSLRKPIMSPEIRQDWIMHHQAQRNFILAQKFVASRFGSPIALWSSDFQCGPVGRGIWFAQGGLKTTANTEKDAPVSWRVLFIPGDSAPLYLRVGAHEEGNFGSALMRAGVPPKTP